MTKSGMIPVIFSYAQPIIKPNRRSISILLNGRECRGKRLTEDQVAAEAKNHLEHIIRNTVPRAVNTLRTVFRRPSGLHRSAPTNTPAEWSVDVKGCAEQKGACAPGRAMAPSSSCHSAVCLMSPSLITLEMIVPENTPLGNVTLIPNSMRSNHKRHTVFLTKSYRNLLDFLSATCQALSIEQDLPGPTGTDEWSPITLEHEPVWHTLCKLRERLYPTVETDTHS